MRIIIETPEGEQTYVIAEGTTLIGREHSCDICIHDPSVSRRHLECTLTAGTLVARDLNTKNGTYLASQRVEEVHVTPGLRLCLGTVYIRFEEEISPPTKATQPIVTESAFEVIPPNAVPIGDDFDDDEEPTPLDENVAQSVLADAAGKGTRLVVRDNKWFVQDIATGAEVEIVPQQGAGQPAAPGDEALPGDVTPGSASLTPMVVSRNPVRPSGLSGPATAIPISSNFNLKALLADPRKRRRVLLGAVGFVILLILVIVWFKPPKERQVMSSARYRALVDEAVLSFEHDQQDESLTLLEKLRKTPVQGRHKLADILLDAMKADIQSETDFRAAWEEAQTRWEEARDSSEATESTQELAQRRLDRVTVELENMVHVNEAKALLLKGDLAACLDRAAQVPEDSCFRAETELLIADTVKTVIAAAEKRAAAAVTTRNWTEAIAALEEIKKYQKDRASDVDPRIAVLTIRKAEEATLAEAKKLASENRHAEAIKKLDSIAPDSHYAQAAETMKKQFASAGTNYQARTAYASGDGKKALAHLAEGGLADSPLARTIEAAIKYRTEADEAFKIYDFDAATEALETLRAVVKDDKNQYDQAAKRQLDNMPQLRTRRAQELMAEAEAANRNRKFVEARALYRTVIQIDPTSRTAAFMELDKLKRAAIDDFNRAIALEGQHPERAYKLYQDVMDRLLPDHRFYRKAEMQILNLELKMAVEAESDAEPDPK